MEEVVVQVDSEGVKYSTKLEGGPSLTKMRQAKLKQLYKKNGLPGDEIEQKAARDRSASPQFD